MAKSAIRRRWEVAGRGRVLGRTACHAWLAKVFGPTVRFAHVERGGVEGVQVLLRKGGEDLVLAQTFHAPLFARAAVMAVRGAR